MSSTSKKFFLAGTALLIFAMADFTYLEGLKRGRSQGCAEQAATDHKILALQPPTCIAPFKAHMIKDTEMEYWMCEPLPFPSHDMQWHNSFIYPNGDVTDCESHSLPDQFGVSPSVCTKTKGALIEPGPVGMRGRICWEYGQVFPCPAHAKIVPVTPGSDCLPVGDFSKNCQYKIVGGGQ
jgi:hypothetical protein